MCLEEERAGRAHRCQGPVSMPSFTPLSSLTTQRRAASTENSPSASSVPAPLTLGTRLLGTEPLGSVRFAKESCTCPTATRLAGLRYDFGQVPIYPKTALPIQAKLAISQPNDAYEREADRVAERVLRMPEQRRGVPLADSQHGDGGSV